MWERRKRWRLAELEPHSLCYPGRRSKSARLEGTPNVRLASECIIIDANSAIRPLFMEYDDFTEFIALFQNITRKGKLKNFNLKFHPKIDLKVFIISCNLQ